ncbi:hypothetical protein POM88_033109 [Heracleum sosnowskyi]|uniref:Ubiquitin-like protease family profile domain-containing protein n=1 Tax=Heracleum sosnowskyi TaxID=360622 RepID=A0AAD8I1R5_9APIA|nr:hypothetical protein POM88_033109 [Heracleum sosnowskyi]
MQSIIDFVGNDVEKKNLASSWMRSNYLEKTHEVDTEMIAEFCELLRTSLRKGIHTYTPLEWLSYLKSAQQNRLKQILDVDQYEMVFIPIVENKHFFSIHIHVMDPCIYILDPLYVNLNEDHQKHLTFVKFLDNAWTSYYVKNNPKQDNTYDCGVYMAKYLEYWGKNEKLPFNKVK